MEIILSQFIKSLAESELMSDSEIQAFIEGLPSDKQPDDGAALAKELVRHKKLTKFQAQAVYQGKTKALILGDYVYGVDSYGQLRCLDAESGDRIWEDLTATPPARWSNIHFVRNGDRIWMFNERGELMIAKLSPKGFHEISRTKLIEPTMEQLRRRDGVCWSHPAFAYRHVFARNDEEIVCASLEAD